MRPVPSPFSALTSASPICRAGVAPVRLAPGEVSVLKGVTSADFSVILLASLAFAGVACSAGEGSSAEWIGRSLYECRGTGADATVVVDAIRLHYDDALNLYVTADAYRDSPGIRSTRERPIGDEWPTTWTTA